MVATSSSVTISLNNESLWKEFHNYTNEMIVTKCGRKVFPKIEISVKGLEPSEQYVIAVQMERVGNSRYKFSNGEWSISGSADPTEVPKTVWHHDSPQLGKSWMRGPICFDRLKLTNCAADGGQKVQLRSMHKYRPRLLIYRVGQSLPFSCFLPTQITQNTQNFVASYSSSDMDFIAVTAYQNQQVISLKIKYNPFAKGFREGNERRRRSESPSSSAPSPCVKRPRTSEAVESSFTIEKICSKPSLPLPPHTGGAVLPPFIPYGFPRWSYSMLNLGTMLPTVSPYALSPPLPSYAYNNSFNTYGL